MEKRNRVYEPLDLLWLALGVVLFAFFGWRWNMPIAAWLCPLFLIRFFRRQDKWYKALIAFPLLAAAGALNKWNAWDIEWFGQVGLSLLLPMPLLVALYVDRFFSRRLQGLLATFVFPAVLVVLDLAISLWPLLGTIISPAATQFELTALIQVASVTGIWGLTFLIGWAASMANLWWEHGFEVRRIARPAAVFVLVLLVVLLGGAARLALARPASSTVRVGGVTVPHPRDYWSEIVDLGTPRGVAHQFEAEVTSLNDQLFAASEQVVAGGAQIVFWSEGNGVVYEEDEAAFLQRAQAFAREHQVYFAPALLVLHYGQSSTDNKLVMITPQGEVAFTYVKTISWYPTDSDGIIRCVDTPYGRIAAAICFDLDFPSLLRQAAQQEVDLVIVPGFDSAGIKHYHTQVGLFRAVEGGFSVVRQVNTGTSMAVDYQGNVLAYQDHFRTTDRTMLADVPTQGV
ncbi:MAG: carbon-nitrogen hydrolase family protein, partial [Anaerolineae bacterium]|nr:carbon-nitrogen hydrolase family protein [Anaerolineae bacterium]